MSLDIYKDGATGDMYYRSASGLLVPVDGTPADGDVPTTQSDGTVAHEAPPSGGGGGGATLIGTPVILAVAQANIPFTAIPGSYANLMIVATARGATAATSTGAHLRFNADTGSNYDWDRNNRFGSAQGSPSTFIEFGEIAAASAPAGTSTPLVFTIPAYASTVLHKSFTCQTFLKLGSGGGNVLVQNCGGLWRSTAAITQIDLFCGAGNWAIGSEFRLYGL